MMLLTGGYEAVQSRAGWLEVKNAGTVSVGGHDRADFLHNMISNDVLGLDLLEGRRGTLLTPTGKMVAEFHYYRLPDSFLFTLQGWDVDHFVNILGSYIIVDDVTLEVWTERFASFSIQGASSGTVVEDLIGVRSIPKPARATRGNWQGHEFLAIDRPDIGDRGYFLLIAQAGREALRQALVGLHGQGIEEVTPAEFSLLRLERGCPLAGTDMTRDSNPLEAGLDDAISLEKGCYVGQEVIAKATHIGGMPRRLVRVRFEGEIAVKAGSTLQVNGSERSIGQVTSCNWSPRLGAVIALARLRSRFAHEGQQVETANEAGLQVTGTVVNDFLG